MPRKTGSSGGSGGAPRKKSWSGSKNKKNSPVGAKKSLGQHFLRDQSVADAIVAAANLTQDDTVLEIGPGPGVLTDRLAAQAGRLLAVELDDRFAAALLARYADNPRVQIVHADILEIDLSTVAAISKSPKQLIAPPLSNADPPVGRASTPDSRIDALTPSNANPLVGRASTPDSRIDAAIARPTHNSPRWKAVANIPYYITSPILRHLLEASTPPELAVIMMQKEVAERICAQPGDLSLLAVSVQYYATPELIRTVPAAAFQPPPQVDSAVVRLVSHAAPLFSDIPTERYFDIVRAGFSQKRKQLANSLSAGLQKPKAEVVALLVAAGIDPERRAETLTLEEWAALARLSWSPMQTPLQARRDNERPTH